ncbi:MAG: CAP domain-containing protein, partial [Thermoanaerobaculia bacterium]
VQDFGARLDVFPVVIDLEAYETSSTTVDLHIYGSGWAVWMMVSEDPAFAGASWELYRENVAWRLSSGPGLKRVHVRLRNAALAVRAASDEIISR